MRSKIVAGYKVLTLLNLKFSKLTGLQLYLDSPLVLETQGGVSEQNKKSSNSSSNSQNENLVTANNRRNRQNVEQVQEQEMGLKQFSTITDLLIKLKGNLSKYLGYFIILSIYSKLFCQ